jgi:uncharacterized protein (TIGR02266 family)
MSSERRTAPRWPAHFEVRFARAADAARAFNVFSINFSSGGICVRTRTPHAVGEVLSMTLSIEGSLFEIEGCVSWVRGDAVGIRFVNLNPTMRAELEKVARVLAKRGPPVT